MKQLINEVEIITDNEYDRASEKFGKCHHSAHEAYAVILEEIEEAKSDIDHKLNLAMLRFWNCTKGNVSTHDKAQEIYEAAIHAAAELIQVAAMAYKATLPYGNETPPNT